MATTIIEDGVVVILAFEGADIVVQVFEKEEQEMNKISIGSCAVKDAIK